MFHLNNGMVLYLREVSSYLALVCLIRANNFSKPGLLDYNINCFRDAISGIFDRAPTVASLPEEK